MTRMNPHGTHPFRRAENAARRHERTRGRRPSTLVMAISGFALAMAGTTARAIDTARIEDPGVRSCVERTIPDYSLAQRLDVRTRDDSGPVSESRGHLSWKRFDDGRAKLVTTIDWPRERAGVSALLVEKEGASPDIWMYLPERRQVRRVGARMLGTSMPGTDLSCEDFTHFQRMADTGEAARLDDAEIGGHPVYVLETFPDEGESEYSRILTYVDQTMCLPVKTEFFAPNGSLHKVLQVDRESIRRVEAPWAPFRSEMVDLGRERRTVLTTADVSIDPDIRDSVFTPAQLRQGH